MAGIVEADRTERERVAVIRDPAISAGPGQFAAIQAVAPSLGVEVARSMCVTPLRSSARIAAFARSQCGGLVVAASALAVTHRELIITLAARHKLPAVYIRRGFVTDGGLIVLRADIIDLWQRAAAYVDRIFKGEKPADLPVQAPTKYELVINLKTAKAMGLTVPPSLLARADEVIE